MPQTVLFKEMFECIANNSLSQFLTEIPRTYCFKSTPTETSVMERKKLCSRFRALVEITLSLECKSCRVSTSSSISAASTTSLYNFSPKPARIPLVAVDFSRTPIYSCKGNSLCKILCIQYNNNSKDRCRKLFCSKKCLNVLQTIHSLNS